MSTVMIQNTPRFRDYGTWGGPKMIFEAFLEDRAVAMGQLQEAGVSFQEAMSSDDESLMEAGSTSDFKNYLSALATKRLMWGYNDVASSWRTYTGIYDVPDFKPISFTRLTEMEDWEQVNEGGSALDSQISEIVGPSFSVNTYERLFSLTRRAIINDDLNQLRQRPAAMGRSAARTLAKSVIAQLEGNQNTYDGNPLFSTAHQNLMSGSAAALTEDSLGLAITLLRLQTDPNGNRIGIRPRTLVVPAQLELIARRILNSVAVPEPQYGVPVVTPNTPYPGATGIQQFGRGGTNVLAGLVQPVVEEYLTDPNDWYLFGNPNEAPVLAAGFLNGQQIPQIFLRDPGMRDVLGGSDPYSMELDEIVWKGRTEWGTGYYDWRGAVKAVVV
jgi:hypothetical protein